jgi:hypothetical protein
MLQKNFMKDLKPSRDLSPEWKRYGAILHLRGHMHCMQKDKQLRNKTYGGSSAVNTGKTNKIASKYNEGR